MPPKKRPASNTPLPKGKAATKKAKGSAVTPENLEKLGELSLKEKVKQIADENSDIDDAADALQDSGRATALFLMRTDASKFGNITRSANRLLAEKGGGCPKSRPLTSGGRQRWTSTCLRGGCPGENAPKHGVCMNTWTTQTSRGQALANRKKLGSRVKSSPWKRTMMKSGSNS